MFKETWTIFKLEEKWLKKNKKDNVRINQNPICHILQKLEAKLIFSVAMKTIISALSPSEVRLYLKGSLALQSKVCNNFVRSFSNAKYL